MSNFDLDELAAELADFAPPEQKIGRSAHEERIIAGFEEIQRYVEQHGHVPQHGEEREIFERLYAVRLDRLRALPDCRALLEQIDHQGLLAGTPTIAASADETIDIDDLAAELADVAGVNDITVLRHVRSRTEIQAAEEIASREKCEDFERFKPLFDEATSGLKTGAWTTKPFGKDARIELGDFFVVGGQIAYVAAMLEGNVTKDGRSNPRLRVIFDNQTESNLLLRSLSRALYPDGNTPVGRRLIKIDQGPLFGDTEEPDDIASGTIYVLRSLSSEPFIAEHRELIHKIGVTGGKVETRIANAETDATYLLAKVEIVATYKLAGINRTRMENLFHRLFTPARLNITINDRFGHPVQPKEWFLAPLFIIDEAVARIKDGSITGYTYDPDVAKLVKVKEAGLR
jgi:hypothetical protein